jgi:hypothetical protein
MARTRMGAGEGPEVDDVVARFACPVADEREVRHLGEEARRHGSNPAAPVPRLAVVNDDTTMLGIEGGDRIRRAAVPCGCVGRCKCIDVS